MVGGGGARRRGPVSLVRAERVVAGGAAPEDGTATAAPGGGGSGAPSTLVGTGFGTCERWKLRVLVPSRGVSPVRTAAAAAEIRRSRSSSPASLPLFAHRTTSAAIRSAASTRSSCETGPPFLRARARLSVSWTSRPSAV